MRSEQQMSIETRSDRAAVTAAMDVDAGPLLGTWINTNAETRQIARVRIAAADAQPILAVWGASRPNCREWGKMPIEQLYGASPAGGLATAFRAEYQLGPMSALLEANLSKGLLIIACLKSFRDRSGRSNYFVREFFRRADDGAMPESVPVDCGPFSMTCADEETAVSPSAMGSEPLDPALFLGRWQNTDAAARGIRAVRIRPSSLDIYSAAEQHGPGFEQGIPTLFAEHPAGRAATQLHTRVDKFGEQVIIHGWVKLGVLVFAVFRRPADRSVGAPWFDREFFYLAE
jgi:hypothetical protein